MPTPMLRPQQCRSGRSARASSWAISGVRRALSEFPRPHATTRPGRLWTVDDDRVVLADGRRELTRARDVELAQTLRQGAEGRPATLRETRREDENAHGISLEVHHLGRVLVHVLDAAVRDRRGL